MGSVFYFAFRNPLRKHPHVKFPLPVFRKRSYSKISNHRWHANNYSCVKNKLNRISLEETFRQGPLLCEILNHAKCICGSIQQIGTHRHQDPHPGLGIIATYNSLCKNPSPVACVATRNFHTSHRLLTEPEKKTNIEKSVKALKELATQKEVIPIFEVTKPEPVVHKKTIRQKVVAEIKHYYHGFRLLFIDIKVSSKLLWRLLNGKSLNRREQRLLVRTVSDMFRLVPFSVFIIVPFMEFALPIFLKLFPGMLPSTFQTSDEKDLKTKQQLKVKLEMAKFLQDTLNDMSLYHSGDHSSQAAKEFSAFFTKIRSSGLQATNDEIIKFSKLFEDELTLDNLSRGQLIALCRLLELQPIGTNNFLRFQLRMKLRSLKADDQVIKKEGIESLTVWELQQACRARGMRAFGMPDDRLRSQLSQWLDLSLNENIPPSLLLLSRALYLSENLPAPDQLAATISILPESIGLETKAKIGEIEGKVDNLVRLQLIKEEEQKIKLEKEEEILQIAETKKAHEAAAAAIKDVRTEIISPDITASLKSPVMEEKEVLVDKAPILVDSAVDFSKEEKEKLDVISPKDIDEIEHALENISTEKKKLFIEKEEMEQLKEDMADYKEDIEELKDVIGSTGTTDQKLGESKAASRLFNEVNRMITQMDGMIDTLEGQKAGLEEQHVTAKDVEKVAEKEEIVSIVELVDALRKLQKTPDDTQMKKITQVLTEMDDDHDGNVKIDDVVKVVELMGKENEKISRSQMMEIIHMLDKEENIEMVHKIEKLMEKDSGQRQQTNEPNNRPSSPQTPTNQPPTMAQQTKQQQQK